jgi:serine/threonine protein kinase
MNDLAPMNNPTTTTKEPITRVGDVIAGKFKVERILGEGGMGVVVAARHIQLDERVALKFLRPEMTNPETVARFDQEARAAVKLKSEHVARVLDVGLREDGLPFIVMEYLRGKDLGELLRESGPLPVEAAAELAIQACEGLAEAHARGIVHRDIKPENLFLVEHGDGWRTLKILDFGISKAVLIGSAVAKGESNIRTQHLMGSPCYMSPEQLRSTQSVDHRTDLWSLGSVLFELLSGSPAYDPDKPLTELIATILEQPPPRLSSVLPGVSAVIDHIIDRCLQQDRDRRFQNAAELAIALMPLAPKRARVAVERATAVTRAAGLSDGRLHVPSSVAPPPMGSSGSSGLSIPSGRVSGRTSRAPTPVPPAHASVLGKYRLVASLSHSSMWDVFVAMSPDLHGKLAVIKRLRQPLAEDPAFYATFVEQARLAMLLDHPNIVQTLDVGEQDGAAFFVTDYIEGQPLDAVVWEAKRAAIRISPLLSARAVADVCAALQYAHELSTVRDKDSHGVIHHHVNPRNVILTYDGQVKLVDFGVAKAARLSTSATSTTSLAPLLRETSGYAAPEQGAESIIDRRADIYSAGVVLWELLADRRLLRGDVSDTALQRFAAEPIPNVTDLVTDVDPELAAIVARAVDKSRAMRFQSAREMREALEAYLDTRDAPAQAFGEKLQGMFALTRKQVEQEIDACIDRASHEAMPDILSIPPARRRDDSGEALEPRHDTLPLPPRADAAVASPSLTPALSTGLAAGRRPRPLVVVALVLVGVLAGGVALAFLGKDERAQPRDAVANQPAALSSLPTPAPLPSARLPLAETSAANVASTATAPPAVTATPKHANASFAPAAAPAPKQPSSKPADSDLDIRMHR